MNATVNPQVSSDTQTPTGLDPERVRADFPVLAQTVNGHPLAYLDNAATTQKPRQVIDALKHYYEYDNSNIHRGVHTLSLRATEGYEAARQAAQRFINADKSQEIVFVRGATEALNLVAQSYGRTNLGPGDEVLITAMEHHSNIVPWQLVCEQTGAELRVAPINDAGELDMDAFDRQLSERTKIVAAAHISNALGTVNPVADIVRRAHDAGAVTVIDGAQATAHLAVDVSALDADFYAFSGHKVFGPTGIGVLYAKEALLEAMPPYQGGGDMIRTVRFEKSTWNDLPYKFEAGTPNIAGGVGLGAALEYVAALDPARIKAYEDDLLAYASDRLDEIPNLRQIGRARERAGAISFVMDDAHPHDIGTIVDGRGAAIRTGHHCAMPVMERYGVPATARASFACYNTRADVDALIEGLHQVQEMFGS
jgi:cysteine desulfurase/selenocysteine lyase